MTWTIKIRTSPGALMTADYECPVHGRFMATVKRDADGNPPDEAKCMEWLPGGLSYCGEWSPWRISCPPVHTQFVVSATQGKAAPKPNADALDTRPLAEGRKNEWRAARKKLREERRHRRVKELLR